MSGVAAPLSAEHRAIQRFFAGLIDGDYWCHLFHFVERLGRAEAMRRRRGEPAPWDERHLPTRCCERDIDRDGNCDRHPAVRS